MRITANMVSSQIIDNLNIDLERLASINQQIATGRRIQQPSDDPLGTQRVINVEEALSRLDQYQRNANYVTNWVHATESSLTGVSDAMLQAYSLSVRGANDATLTQTELDAIADEVNGVLENIYQASNTSLEGKYIFSGFQTPTEAFAATRVAGEITAVNYAGDSGVDQVEIELGQTVNKNLPGDGVFQPGAGLDVFGVLITLRDDLRAGNLAGVTAAVGTTQTGRQQILDQIAALGGKTNQLEMSGENLSEKKFGLIKLESQLADVDMPEAIVRLQTAQNVYTAALASSARILEQPQLMNFLG